MLRLCSFALAAVLIGGIALESEGVAAERPQLIDVTALPKTGLKPADFVPPGWKLEAVIEGDLNGDKTRDSVLELIEDLPAMKGEEVNERYRALVVLLQTNTGQLRRVGVAPRLLRCTTCFGAMAGPEGGNAEIKIAKGVLIVDELWGSRETVRTTLRFRLEPAEGRVKLIGEDVVREDRGTGEQHKDSRNFLTGQQVSGGAYYDKQRERWIKIPSRRQTIHNPKRFIEDIAYQDYER